MSEYQEHKSDYQVNFNWGETFNMTVKAPVVAKRIFNTLSDALAYANNLEDNAVDGVRLTILNDPNGLNNGVYYIKSIGDGTQETPASLEKVSATGNQWFSGTAVTLNDRNFTYRSIKNGDMYLNNSTLDLFKYDVNSGWQFLTNIRMSQPSTGVMYYYLSRDGVNVPEAPLNEWSTTIPTITRQDMNGQWFLWTKLYYNEEDEVLHPKNSVSLYYSSLDLGTFQV